MTKVGKWALALHGATALIGWTIAFSTLAKAHDPDSHSTLAGWAEEQQVMPAAKSRFSCDPNGGSCSCCNGAEIVRGKFRLVDGDEAWDWLNPKTNQWQRVPEDIIHWGEPTPDKQAVAFEYPIGSGILRCFFPAQSDG